MIQYFWPPLNIRHYSHQFLFLKPYSPLPPITVDFPAQVVFSSSFKVFLFLQWFPSDNHSTQWLPPVLYPFLLSHRSITVADFQVLFDNQWLNLNVIVTIFVQTDNRATQTGSTLPCKFVDDSSSALLHCLHNQAVDRITAKNSCNFQGKHCIRDEVPCEPVDIPINNDLPHTLADLHKAAVYSWTSQWCKNSPKKSSIHLIPSNTRQHIDLSIVNNAENLSTPLYTHSLKASLCSCIDIQQPFTRSQRHTIIYLTEI